MTRPSHLARISQRGLPVAAALAFSFPGLAWGQTTALTGATIIATASRESSSAWVKQLGADNPHRVTEHAHDERLASWSPDGEELAFVRFSSEDQACGIFRTSVLGGPAATGSSRR